MRSGGITRNSQIDGLRGYLATGVFLHHFYIAWGYEISGRWVAPENVIFRNLGLVAVSLFFMITAYLFYGKILSSQGKLNWRRLYVGRVQRLWPMYAVSIAVLLLIVATHTGFVAHESYLQLGWEALNWLAFTIPSAPDVNGYNGTASIVAAVTWTLLCNSSIGSIFHSSVPSKDRVANLRALDVGYRCRNSTGSNNA